MSTLHVQVRAKLRHFTLDTAFSAAEGITVIFGPSGSGKTTLLDCISGLRMQHAARITFDSEALSESGRHRQVPVHRRNIGYVLQSLGLFEHLTVTENVAYGLSNLGAAERDERVAAMLNDLGITHLAQQRASDISGGERQRVALARALVLRPRALLLDEPLSALDIATKLQLTAEIKRWVRAHPIPVLYVTHSLDEVFALADRVLRLEKGRITGDGLPKDLLEREREQLLAELR